MSEQLQIEQALLGYQEGHHLITSSVGLAPRTKQFLANVTDVSGPEGFEGFDIAYTGLPVPDSKFYALFCTWPAPEMPRPGCVWSHLLLLKHSDLAHIPDLSFLRKLFIRPNAPTSSPAYETPLDVFVPDGLSGNPLQVDQERAKTLVWALYGNPDSEIVILDKEAEPWEATVFAMWSQQWPKLRERFCFSTGSLGDRRSTGVAFDLQIAPESSKRLWGSLAESKTVVVDSAKNPMPQSMEPWIQHVVGALGAGSSSSLRRFLFDYGVDTANTRSSFRKLAECSIQPDPDVDNSLTYLLIQIAKAFPGPKDALTLKRDKLNEFFHSNRSNDLESCLAGLYFLLQSSDASAFGEIELKLDSQVKRLWERKQAELLSLLGSNSVSSWYGSVLKALAPGLGASDIPTLWREQSSIIPRVLVARPELATESSAWTVAQDGQRALWDGLRAATKDMGTWSLAAGAMIDAECALREKETVALAGPSISEGLLKWLGSSSFKLPSNSWRKALRTPLSNMLGDQDLPPPLLALAGWVLPAGEARAIPGDRCDLEALAKRGLDSLPKELASHTVFWLTALGLRTPGESGLALLGKTFFRVYDAVAASHYPGEAWELLAPVLPEPPFWLIWDRCRRLRDALHQWLLKNPSYLESLRKAAPSVQHAELVERLR